MNCNPRFAVESAQKPAYDNALVEHEAFVLYLKKSIQKLEQEVGAVSANIVGIQNKVRQKVHNSEEMGCSVQAMEELQCEETKSAKTQQISLRQLKELIEKREKEIRCQERMQQRNIETLRNQILSKREEMEKAEAELREKLERDCKCDLLLHDEKSKRQDIKEVRHQTRKSIEHSYVERAAYQPAPDYIKSKQRELKRVQEEKECVVQCAKEIENNNVKLQTELDILERKYQQAEQEEGKQEKCIENLEDEIKCAQLEKECNGIEFGQLTRQLNDLQARNSLLKRIHGKLADQTRCQLQTIRALEQNYQTCGNDVQTTDVNLESTDTGCNIKPTDCLGQC